jgi:glycosyltransferase involved in cell wall biosynthesis
VATVGLNLLYLAPGETGGMETYARALVPRLVAARPNARFFAFVARELADEMRDAPWSEGLRVIRLPVSARTRVRRSAAEQTLLAVAARRARVDVLHSLASSTPFVPGPATVVTIQDLIYKRFPETHAGVLSTGMAAIVRTAAARARRIIVPSRATARDLVTFLGTEESKIDVVPLGPGAEGHPQPLSEPQVRSRLGLGKAPIVLSPSAKRPHKNLGRLIQALARLDGDPAPVLVVPGYASRHESELLEQARRSGVIDRVRLTGWLADDEMEGLYAAAACVALPSLAEGFGLPVLEAMRRGVPVACSDATSLPEVAGDAALLFEPTSVEAIAGALQRLLADGALRAELVRRGLGQAGRFTWDAAAAGTLASYDRTLGSSSSRTAIGGLR